MSDVPTIREELTRKSLDQLEKLVYERESGLITEAQFSVGLDTLWNCVSGLTGNDFMELISMSKVKKDDASFGRSAFMVKDGKWLQVFLKSDFSIMVRNEKGFAPDLLGKYETFALALRKMEEVAASLELKGYARI